jgi:hypothetical protein
VLRIPQENEPGVQLNLIDEPRIAPSLIGLSGAEPDSGDNGTLLYQIRRTLPGAATPVNFGAR